MLLASEVLSYWAAINTEEAAVCRSVSARVKSPSEEERKIPKIRLLSESNGLQHLHFRNMFVQLFCSLYGLYKWTYTTSSCTVQ